MRVRKLSVIGLSALLVIATGCGAPNKGKASSDVGSTVVSSQSASLVLSSSPQSVSSGVNGSQSVGKWVEKASMSTPRFNGGSAVVDGKIYMFSGFTSDYYHGTASAEVYDPASNQWQKIKSMPTGLHDMQVAVLSGKIYIIGGAKYDKNSYGDIVNAVERYNPATDTWTDLKPMNIVRTDFSLVALNGKLYAIGGENEKNAEILLPSVEAYDPNTDTWKKEASLPSPRSQFTTEVIDGKIYVIGSLNLSDGVVESSGPMELYDPETNQWTAKAAMHVNRSGFQTETINEKIYVIGGWDPHSNGGSIAGVLTSMEEYDPATDKWTMKAPMIEKKGSFQTVVVNGKIYVIGGWNDIKYGDQAANYLSSVQEYNPKTNKWTEKSPLKMGRRGFDTAVINDSIYAIGGLVGPDRGGAGTALVEEYTVAK